MSLLISAYCAAPRDLTDAQNQVIDRVSFSLSEGNWREHLSEIGMDEAEDDIDLALLDRLEEDFLARSSSRAQDQYTAWHLGLAQKVRALIAAARPHGCTLIGAAD